MYNTCKVVTHYYIIVLKWYGRGSFKFSIIFVNKKVGVVIDLDFKLKIT